MDSHFVKETKRSEGTKRALLIGINYFNTSSELHGCHNDIDNMRRYLTDLGYSEFAVLKDSRADTFLPTAKSIPTKANILSAMKEAIKKTQAGDTLYIHYSGHGSYLRDQNGDESDNRDECICPVDYPQTKGIDSGFIRDDDMNTILVKGLAEGAKLRVCFDSCHSGSALDLPILWNSSQRFQFENTSKVGKDIVFISGCMDEQTSADAYINGQSSGAMTWALLDVLCDIKKSGKHASEWSWKELIQMMRFALRKARYDQIPQLSLVSQEQITEKVDLI